MYLGDSYHALNDFKSSDDFYEKALILNPKNIYVLNNYGYYLSLRSERLERAAELSLKANELEPNQSNYQDTYGWILYKQKKYEEAKEWLEKAVNGGGGGNGVILEHLGDIYFQLKKTDEAMLYWEKAKGKAGVTEFLDKKINFYDGLPFGYVEKGLLTEARNYSNDNVYLKTKLVVNKIGF